MSAQDPVDDYGRDTCEYCGERVTREQSVLCDGCSCGELRKAVDALLKSATPNPCDHPTMTRAWEIGRLTLERTGGEVKP